MGDFRKQALKGSPSRDEFKRRHKELSKDLYALDIDFVLIEKFPFPDIVAALDYKTNADEISFSEVLAYGALVRRGIVMIIVQGDVDSGRFTISQFVGGNHVKPRSKLKELTTTENWQQYEDWEKRLRKSFIERWKP